MKEIKEYTVSITLTEETEAKLINLTEKYNNFPGKDTTYPFAGYTPEKVLEMVLNFGTKTTIMELISYHEQMLQREKERDAERAAESLGAGE